MELGNRTTNSYILQLEGFNIPQNLSYPVFFILLFVYLMIIVSNIGLITLISNEASLQQPMYLLYCNLSINDILGNTNILPRLMLDIISSERYVTYVQCVIQAFMTHICATAAHTILMIMAFDRYVAICYPLRYPSIMTTSMVLKLSAFAWGVTIVLVFILLGLTIRLNRCRSVILNAYCDNPSLFKLSCEDVSINNIYGLAFTAVLFSCSMGSIALTYLRIFAVCVTKKSKDLNSKALQTCGSHLVVYMIMLWTGFLVVISHRLQSVTYRNLAAVLFLVIPGNLNPIIYGLQTKALKSKIIKIFRPKVTSM